jgi:uncharacterized protein YegP (UPF0339 family)
MRSLVRVELGRELSGVVSGKPCPLFLTHKHNRKVTAMKYRFEYIEGQDGQWYTSIRHVNGQKLFTSEGYTRRESACETLENFVSGIVEDFLKGQLEKLYAGSKRDGQ